MGVLRGSTEGGLEGVTVRVLLANRGNNLGGPETLSLHSNNCQSAGIYDSPRASRAFGGVAGKSHNEIVAEKLNKYWGQQNFVRRNLRSCCCCCVCVNCFVAFGTNL